MSNYLFVLLLLSCQDGDIDDPAHDNLQPKKVAMEVLVHQVSIDQYETPDPDLHAS